MKLEDSVQEEASIGFSAGSSLLRDDQTKTGSPKVYFTQDDRFFVYGAKTLAGTRKAVFTGDAVDTPNGSSWDYAPHRFWDFNSSRYDFLAIAGPETNAGISCNPEAAGTLSAQVAYDPVASQYDLMAACKRRLIQSHTAEPVDLVFYHMLSAVTVTVINDSPSAIPVTLNSYRFQNLCTQATGTVSQNDDTPLIASVWGSPSYNTNAVLGAAPACILAGRGGQFPASEGDAVTDLMIPQEFGLSLTYIPRLVLEYEYLEDGESTPTRVVTGVKLQEIKSKTDGSYIEKWMPGVRYQYEVHLRQGGGVRVHVNTTPWEEVHAETPGVTI